MLPFSMLSIYLELSIEAWLDTQWLVWAKILDRLDIVCFRSYPNKRHWMSVYRTINMLTLIIWIRWWVLDLPNELRFVFPLAMRREPLVWYFGTIHTPNHILPNSSSRHWWSLLESGICRATKCEFSKYILSSTSISWHSLIKKNLSLSYTHTSSPSPNTIIHMVLIL